MQPTHVEEVARRIRTGFVETPGLHLTFWQAQRLWHLPDEVCDRALSALTGAGYLVRTPDGRYRRSHREWPPAAASVPGVP
jgi:hypothetical protein